jgi:hypothetical protein
MMSKFPPEIPPSKKNDSSFDATTGSEKFRFAWGEWGLGGKTILVAACVAIASVFMKWIDLTIASSNGFQQGAVLLLGIFVYPILQLLKNKPIHFYIGLACAGFGALSSLIFMARTSMQLPDGSSVFLFGSGPMIFLLASLALGYGIYKYQSD